MLNAQARRAQVPVVNWAWLADAASPGSAAAGACEEQLLWDLPPAFLEGGWATLGVRCACLRREALHGVVQHDLEACSMACMCANAGIRPNKLDGGKHAQKVCEAHVALAFVVHSHARLLPVRTK